MENLFGAVSTHIRRKVNELVAGYNSNATNIVTNTAGIASILAGNVGEHIAAAGNNQATAAALSASKFIHRVTGANGSLGVRLPAGVAGQIHIIVNTVNNTLNIFPATGEEINNGGANTVFVGTALYTVILEYQDAANGWITARFLVA